MFVCYHVETFYTIQFTVKVIRMYLYPFICKFKATAPVLLEVFDCTDYVMVDFDAVEDTDWQWHVSQYDFWLVVTQKRS
jgi:hypothetical protein